MKMGYKPSFLRDFKRLEPALQDAAREKIELFKDKNNHEKLKVHKLRGRLKDYYSFSISYSHRIVFQYEANDFVVFLGVGDHDIYK
jgi:addiction module RelE/StbE family toxin